MKRIGPFAFALVGCASLAAPARAQFKARDLYVACAGDHIQRVDTATWSVSTFADAHDGLVETGSLGFTPDGASLLYCDCAADQMFSFDSAGQGTVIHDSRDGLVYPFGENGIAFAANGDLYVSDFGGQKIVLFPAGGGAATTFADVNDGIARPDGLAFVANGDLLVANREKYEVLRIDPSGAATVFDTLTADDPYTIVVRDNGDVYVATFTYHAILRYPGGDASQRKVFLKFPNSKGNPVLQFGPGQEKLYFTSHLTGNLIEIDPDTAAWTEVIAPGGISGAMAMAFARVKGSWSNYGAGLPGTNGVPDFTAREDPSLGTTVDLDLDNSYGQPTTGVLLAGFQQASLHTGLGGDVLLLPAFLIPISFSFGGDSFSFAIPDDPALLAFEIDLQAVEADPGAVKGVSFTQGLQLLLGF